MHHYRRITTTATTGHRVVRTASGRRLGPWYRRPFHRVWRSAAAERNHPRWPSAHGALLPAGGCNPFWRMRGVDGPSSEGHGRLTMRWRATAVNSPNGPRPPAPATTLVGQDALSAVLCDGATFNISLAFLKHANANGRARKHNARRPRADVVDCSRVFPSRPAVVGTVINFPDR